MFQMYNALPLKQASRSPWPSKVKREWKWKFCPVQSFLPDFRASFLKNTLKHKTCNKKKKVSLLQASVSVYVTTLYQKHSSLGTLIKNELDVWCPVVFRMISAIKTHSPTQILLLEIISSFTRVAAAYFDSNVSSRGSYIKIYKRYSITLQFRYSPCMSSQPHTSFTER